MPFLVFFFTITLKKLRNFCITFFLVLIISLSGQSQINYRQITTDNGLPSNEVYSILQDAKGFMWFGTNAGLCKYDGYTFKIFTVNDDLPDNAVYQLFEDSLGRMWPRTYSYEIVFIQNDSVKPYPFNNTIKKLLEKNANFYSPQPYYVDKSGNVCQSYKGVGMYQINNKGVVSKKIESQSDEKGITIWRFNNSDFLWYNNGLKNITIHDFLKNQTHNSPFPKIDYNPYFGSSLFITFINAYCVIALSNNIILFKDGRFLKKYLLNNEVILVSKDSKGFIWVGLKNGGLHAYKIKNNELIIEKQLFQGLSVTSVVLDKEGSYWIATLENGIFYIPNITSTIFNNENGIKENNILKTAIDSAGNCWFASKTRLYSLSDNKIESYSTKNENNPLNPISNLYYDSFNQTLWLSRQYEVYYLKNKQLSSFPFSISPVFKNKGNTIKPDFASLKCMLVAKDGNMFFGQRSSFRKFNRQGELVHCSFNDSSYTITPYTMYEDEQNTIWIGSQFGLWKYSDTGSYQNKGKSNYHLSYYICDISKNSKYPFLWIATKGHGLIIYNPLNNKTFCITEKNGLSSNDINCIKFFKDEVWVGTNSGLDLFYLKKTSNSIFTIQHFYDIHGLASNTINDIEVNENKVYIASPKGFVVIDKQNMLPNKTPPPIYIKKITINQRDTLLKNNYTLPYYKNFIKIDFVGLSYKKAGNLFYQYRLTGLQNEWQTISINTVSFFSLPKGKYTFEVRAINEDGFYSDTPASIIFKINPPFYQTWWFYLLVIFTASAITASVIYMIQQIKIREIRKRNALLNELSKVRQQALAQQMRPHFIFNAINAFQYFIYSNNKEKTNEYLSKFARLMRLILNNSQSETIPLQNEIEAMQLYMEFEKLRFIDKLEYQIIIDEELDLSFYKIPSLLIQPFLENAIVHGITHKTNGVGRVTLEIKQSEDVIFCVIEDNGVGREKSNEINIKKNKTYPSLGTTIAEKRLKLISSIYKKKLNIKYIDLKDASGFAIGTRIEITIPLC